MFAGIGGTNEASAYLVLQWDHSAIILQEFWSDKCKGVFHAFSHTKQETPSSQTMFFNLGTGLCCVAKASLEDELLIE